MYHSRHTEMGFSFSKKLTSRVGRVPGTHLPARYYFLILAIILSLHLLLTVTHDTYGRATALSKITPGWVSNRLDHAGIQWTANPHDRPLDWGTLEGDHYPRDTHYPQIGAANATFVILARNDELKNLVRSLQQIEDRFNHAYHYPYVFLNDEPFTEEFKAWTSNIVSSKVMYGQIPYEHWNQPDDIDEKKATEGRLDLIRHKVIYGGSVSYRNMCRFNSGFFFRHELVQQYRYYWRIEPGVEFFCDVEEDPFMFMQENNKLYGFTISMYEFQRTVPTLWDATKEFVEKHPEYLAEDNAIDFLSDDDGETYNLCHFWSNFEIADLDFWRSEAYMAYFEHLESKGGFYYERWGDAPVHSIGVSLFAKKDQIHFFKDIGYRHNPFQHCPQGALHTKGRCSCEEADNFDYGSYSCTARYDRLFTQQAAQQSDKIGK